MIDPKRITDAVGSWAKPEYATKDAFNCNVTLLLLEHQASYHLHDGQGAWIKALNLPADCEPWWSTTDPDVFYFRRGNALKRINVRTGFLDTVHIFSEFETINSGGGEADIQGSTLVLCGDGREIFTYDISIHSRSASVEWPTAFNALYLTPSLDVLVCANSGVHLLERGTMKYVRKVAATLAHNDVCRFDGEDCLVRTNANDAAEDLLAVCGNGIEIVPLADPSDRRCIWAIGWSPLGGPQSAAVHISSTDLGWSAVSVYYPLNSAPGGIFKVPHHEGSVPELLCRHNSVMMRDPDTGGMAYNPAPKATVSRDGSRFVFSSNNGDTTRGPDYCDVWLGQLVPVPIPAPIPPIVVQPNPLAAELAACKLANERSLARQREYEDANTQLEAKLEAAYERIAEFQQEQQDTWQPVDFAGQQGRQWAFEVLPSLKLQMSDVLSRTDGILAPITNWHEGNEYLFRAVKDADGVESFEMLERPK